MALMSLRGAKQLTFNLVALERLPISLLSFDPTTHETKDDARSFLQIRNSIKPYVILLTNNCWYFANPTYAMRFKKL